MTSQDKQALGCMGTITVVILIGVALRSHSFVEFLVMLGLVILAWVAFFSAIVGWASPDSDKKTLGAGCGCYSLILVVAIGIFLITGNYGQATEIAKLNFQALGATASTATLEATPTPTATPAPTATPTPTPTPRPTRTPAPSSVAASRDLAWLWNSSIPTDSVTNALQDIWRLPEQNARYQAGQLIDYQRGGAPLGQQAAGLLIGVAFERAGDPQSARQAYSEVSQAGIAPYSISATWRVRILDTAQGQTSDRDSLYTTLTREPDNGGWFLVSNQWIWTTTHQAAWQNLIDLRADHLSFRFFQLLRSWSPLPEPYAYLFILFVLTLGVKFVALPLYLRSAKLTIQLQRIQPEIRNIQAMFKDDAQRMNLALTDLYQRHQINLSSGCLVSIVDLIFVIWAMVSLADFMPQLALDHAQFWWVEDVTQFNLAITIAWGILYLLQAASASRQRAAGQTATQLSCGFLVSFVIIVGIAWLGKWPAYVFIFWFLLSAVGFLMSKILTVIMSAAR